MVTNYPQQLTAAAEVTRKATPEAGLMARMATRLGQVVCGLHGHDAVLHFEGNRVMMRCTSCGHDTPVGRSPVRVPGCVTRAMPVGIRSSRTSRSRKDAHARRRLAVWISTS